MRPPDGRPPPSFGPFVPAFALAGAADVVDEAGRDGELRVSVFAGGGGPAAVDVISIV